MRIGLVITAMGCGGAEGIMARLAAHLASEGHQVGLLVLHGGTVFFDLDSRIDLAVHPQPDLAGKGRLRRFQHRLAWLRRRIVTHDPEVVLSFIDVANVTTLLATRGTSIPVVVAERTYPPIHHLPRPYRLARRLLYPTAAALVVQSTRTAKWARRTAAPGRVEVIPNPVARPGGIQQPPASIPLPPGRRLVSMGRLDAHKGFDTLIDCFAELGSRHPDWSLLIVGEGEFRPQLERRIRDRGLGERVLLTGAVQRPETVLQHCHLFGFASRYEGFPNALCEAMACGLAAVSFDCAAGPSDIIRHEVDGLLVPPGDTAGLTAALDRLMSDDTERRRLAQRAAEICTRFDPEPIFRRWEAVLEAAAGRRIMDGEPCAE